MLYIQNGTEKIIQEEAKELRYGANQTEINLDSQTNRKTRRN